MVEERRQERVERDSCLQVSESSGPAESEPAGGTVDRVSQLVIRILMRPDTNNMVTVTRNQKEEMTLVL